MKLRLTLFFIALFQVTQAQYNNFTIEQVLSAPFPTGLIGHPQEDRFAWVFNDEGSRNIWMADQSGTRQLTSFEGDNGQDISNLQFASDGPTLLFHRGGAPNRRGELPNPDSEPLGVARDIYEFDYEQDSLRHLAEGYSAQYVPDDRAIIYLKNGSVFLLNLQNNEEEKLFGARGSISQLTWHPSGEALAFRSGRGDHSFIGIYRLGAQSIEFIDPSVDNDQSPIWSVDGTKLAYIRIPNQKQILPFSARRSALPWALHIYDYASGASERIWRADPGTGSAFKGVSASNQIFYTNSGKIVFPWEKNGYTNLYAIADDGSGLMELTPGKFEVQYVSISPDKGTILCSSNESDVDRQHIYSINPNTGAKSQLTEGVGIEWAPVINGAGQSACLASSYHLPAHPYRIDDNLNPLAFQVIPTDFPSDYLVQPEQVIFSAADGMQIHGQLFTPKGIQPGQRFPAAIFFHGGSRRQMLLGFHHRGYYHNAYALNQFLADQGYVVLSVNYRSGIGYGMEFREALEYGAQGASEYNDVIGAGLYLQSRDDVIDEKIGLWGGSYGGYLTALGLARGSELFAAGVDIHGVHDWNVVIQNFVPGYNSNSRKEFAELAYLSSPMADIDTWTSPVLVIHGDDDRNVPFSETVDLVEALRNRGIEAEQLIFPDEVHGFLLHRNWLAAYHATADFFDRKLKMK